MSVIQAVFLAILQGFTEFLPISSSGHLVLAQQLFNLHSPQLIAFDVFVHFGTLLSVVVAFRHDVMQMLISFIRGVSTFHIKKEYTHNEYFRLAIAVLIGSIPAGVLGLLFRHQVEEAFTDPKLAAMNIVITGLILFLTRLAKPVEGKKVGFVSSIIIGMAQAVAILPGISRSGSTMSVALFLKTAPVQAARFSFLLSIPVIAGASLVETYKLLVEGTTLPIASICVGIVISAIAGYVAIKLLLRIMEKGKFSVFSVYCLFVGILGLFFI